MKADDNHMKINIGNHEFTELWDGVLYKALSDYPNVSDNEMKDMIDFVNYEKINGRQCEIEADNEDIIWYVQKEMLNPEKYKNVRRPEIIRECTACKARGWLYDRFGVPYSTFRKCNFHFEMWFFTICCKGVIIMRIEHVALYVNNLENTKKFFMKYLGAKSNDGYHNQKTGFCSYFLTFEDGARIEIMNIPEMADLPKKLARTGYSHIAFSVGSIEKVDALTAELKADGYEVISGPRTTGDGYYESCIVAVEDNQIEITV